MESTRARNIQTAAPPPGASEPRGSSRLGKEEFLKILMAQLGHQDPTSPADSRAFVAELAQFASLELSQNLSSTLDSILVGQAALHQTQVTSLIGREALYRTDTVELAEEPATMLAHLSAKAESVTAVITDESGRKVRTITLGGQPAGALEITWDGRDDAGATLPPGTYKVSITAAGTDGKSVGVEQRARGRITGVSFIDGVPELVVGSGSRRIKLSDAVEIKERSTP